MKFTVDQEKSYKAEGNNFLISAGAGSGKTQVLSERVRFLIQERGYHIDEFLILTFTNLAAGEMKERIRTKLEKVAPQEADKIDSASICTFDSYAYSIVKKYHYLLSLSNDVKMVDDNVITIRIKKQIIKILDELYDKEDTILSSFVKTFCFKDDSTLVNLIYSIYAKSISALDESAYLNNLKEKCDYKIFNEGLLKYEKEIDEIIDDFNNCWSQIDNEKYLQKVSHIFDGYYESSSLDEKVNSLKNIKFPVAKNVDPQIQEEIKKLKKELEDYLEPYDNENLLLKEFSNNKQYTCWIVSLVEKLIAFDKKYKWEHQVFSFSDIAKMAIKIFKENQDIALSIKNSLKTIMIDEYQDTSLLQETFLSYISNDNVYMVGDVKQSIYRFRKATPELFIEKFINYQKNIGGELISLQDNFRSRGEVLDDINEIFSDIMTLECGGANYKKDHRIGKGNLSYAAAGDTKQSHSLVTLTYDKEIVENKDEAEARFIAQDIIKKMNEGYLVYNGDFNNPGLRKARLDDFCILMDRGTSFLTYQKVFKEYRIPLFVENNTNISSNEVVMSICSLLKLIKAIRKDDYTSSEFKHAYFSFARSFIIGRKDDELYHDIQLDINVSPVIVDLKKWLNDNQHLSTYPLILDAVSHFNIYSKLIGLGDILVYEKYLDYFLNALKSLHDLNFTFDEYINYFESINEFDLKLEIPSSSTSFEAVKIMNIFKSKGLEFPIIYCSGLTKTFNTEQFKNDFIISEQYGIIYPRYNFSHSIFFLIHKVDEMRDELSEKIRIFYVALTRAKEKIIMVAPQDMKIKPLEKARSLGDIFAPFVDKFETEDVEVLQTNLKYNSPNVDKVILNVNNISLPFVKKEKIKNASKELSFNTHFELLNKGEKLHAILENIDFTNPDFSLLTDSEKQIIEKFLTLPLIKGLKKPEFYKEYEFIDDEINVKGIIDCLIIDDGKAYIIDYKLKNINDELYHKQLRVYADFVTKYFKVKPECYLYSILKGELQKIDI